jgi:hypothetical protein
MILPPLARTPQKSRTGAGPPSYSRAAAGTPCQL